MAKCCVPNCNNSFRNVSNLHYCTIPKDTGAPGMSPSVRITFRTFLTGRLAQSVFFFLLYLQTIPRAFAVINRTSFPLL